MGEKSKKFDFEEFKDQYGDLVFNAVSSVPEEWKSSAADFVACQAVIAGARNTYEGIGILEAVKLDYIQLCEEVYQQEMCDECRDKVCMQDAPQSGSQVK